eukprot:GHVS01079595.1.p1 GENE.GHVS01079595.1~~GHVS01079595.1.p1  ORF type:complete len:106 (-),score=20.47 GHVS01079595.1:150-467(-)
MMCCCCVRSVDEVEAVQEVELVEDFHGSLEYPLKAAKLLNVNTLTLYFHGCLGGDSAECMKLFYIGLRGIGSSAQRKAVVTVYETLPNIADHEVHEDNATPHFGV